MIIITIVVISRCSAIIGSGFFLNLLAMLLLTIVRTAKPQRIFTITAVESEKAIEIAKMVAELGNPNSITDVGVGAQIAYTGVIGGIYNVLINLKDIKDEEFNSKMRKDCDVLKLKAQRMLTDVTEVVEGKL